MEELLNKKELAAKLKVSIPTVNRWLRIGMPRLKIGYIVRFRLSEVEEWVKNGGK